MFFVVVFVVDVNKSQLLLALFFNISLLSVTTIFAQHCIFNIYDLGQLMLTCRLVQAATGSKVDNKRR